MKTVLINVPFKDKYTGEVYVAGKTYAMSEERVNEIKEVNPNFITVAVNEPVSTVEENPEVVEEQNIIRNKKK